MKNLKPSLTVLFMGVSLFLLSGYLAAQNALAPSKVAFDAVSVQPPQLLSPSVDTIIQTPAVEVNVGAGFSPVDSRFTAPSRGVYQFNANVAIDSVGQSCGAYILSMFLNGNEDRRVDRVSGGGQFELSGSSLLSLNQGDVLDIRVFHNCPNAILVEADGEAHFSGALIFGRS